MGRKRGLGMRAGEVRRRRRVPHWKSEGPGNFPTESACMAAETAIGPCTFIEPPYTPPDGGIIQCTDAASLGLDDSWFYTWGATDSVGAGAGFTKCARERTRVAREFVPMVLNCQQADQIWNNIGTYKTARATTNFEQIVLRLSRKRSTSALSL